jgi:hypothetical protein
MTPQSFHFLCEIEAVANGRIDNDVSAMSKLTKVAALAQAIMKEATGSRDNPIYTPGRRLMPTTEEVMAEFDRLIASIKEPV